MIGIYKITNPSGKVYIGQAIDIERRWRDHHHKSNWAPVKLYNSFRKYGVDNHIFEVIEQCEKEDLNLKERYYQDKYNVLEEGLNHVLQDADEKSKVYSEEARLKMSERAKMRSCINLKEYSSNIKGKSYEERYGKEKAAEILKKKSKASKGYKHSEGAKQKMSKFRKGKPIKVHQGRKKVYIPETNKWHFLNEELFQKALKGGTIFKLEDAIYYTKYHKLIYSYR
jgi:group I intron endonuclease